MIDNDLISLFPVSQKCKDLFAKLKQFMDRENFEAAEKRILADYATKHGDERWSFVHPELDRLKRLAKAEGLWNLWLPKEFKQSPGLTNVEVKNYECIYFYFLKKKTQQQQIFSILFFVN